MRKSKMVDVHLRLPIEVCAYIDKMATPSRSAYKIMRDIISSYAKNSGNMTTVGDDAMLVMREVVEKVGYTSVDELMVDLAKSFLKVWQYNNNELEDDEPTPDETIRDMFDNLVDNNIINDCDEKGYSIGRRI